MAAYAPTFMAGAYSVLYNNVLLGYTEAGFEVIVRPSANIIRLDPAGRMPIDALWTGIEDVIIRIESMEWSAAKWAQACNFFHGNATTGMFLGNGTEGNAAPAGKLIRAGIVAAGGTAGVLTLTPTPDAGATQYAYTYTYAYPLEPVRTILSAQRLRTTPVGFFVFGTFDDTTFVSTMYTATAGS